MARRPENPFSAAEAAFKPVKKTGEASPTAAASVPGARELVSIRIDKDVLDHFQADGPGWQDRINTALRDLVIPPVGAEGIRPEDLNATNDD